VLAYILTRVTPRLRSHELARYLGMRPMLVCDNLYQAKALMRQPYRLPADNIIVVPGAPGPPTGAAFKRDYVCRKVAAEGEWMAWLDDNVSCLTGLPPFLSADRLDFSAPHPVARPVRPRVSLVGGLPLPTASIGERSGIMLMRPFLGPRNWGPLTVVSPPKTTIIFAFASGLLSATAALSSLFTKMMAVRGRLVPR
jgi:hypothetical protein